MHVGRGSVCVLKGSVCVLRGSVCVLRGSVCVLRGSVCVLRGSVCVLRGSVCDFPLPGITYFVWLFMTERNGVYNMTSYCLYVY